MDPLTIAAIATVGSKILGLAGNAKQSKDAKKAERVKEQLSNEFAGAFQRPLFDDNRKVNADVRGKQEGIARDTVNINDILGRAAAGAANASAVKTARNVLDTNVTSLNAKLDQLDRLNVIGLQGRKNAEILKNKNAVDLGKIDLSAAIEQANLENARRDKNLSAFRPRQDRQYAFQEYADDIAEEYIGSLGRGRYETNLGVGEARRNDTLADALNITTFDQSSPRSSNLVRNEFERRNRQGLARAVDAAVTDNKLRAYGDASFVNDVRRNDVDLGVGTLKTIAQLDAADLPLVYGANNMEAAARGANVAALGNIDKDYTQGVTDANLNFTDEFYGARGDNVRTVGNAQVNKIVQDGITRGNLFAEEGAALADYFTGTANTANDQLKAKLDAITGYGNTVTNVNDSYLANMGNIYDRRINGTSATGNWMQTGAKVLDLGAALASAMPRTFNANSAMTTINSTPKFNQYTPSAVMPATTPVITTPPQFRI
jgi:hypothetical protein